MRRPRSLRLVCPQCLLLLFFYTTKGMNFSDLIDKDNFMIFVAFVASNHLLIVHCHVCTWIYAEEGTFQEYWFAALSSKCLRPSMHV